MSRIGILCLSWHNFIMGIGLCRQGLLCFGYDYWCVYFIIFIYLKNWKSIQSKLI